MRAKAAFRAAFCILTEGVYAVARGKVENIMDSNPTLEEHGYMRLPYPPALKAAVAEAVSAWKAFCALPEEVKLHFTYTNDTTVGSGVGYELKKGGNGVDVKENFHVRASQRPFLMAEAQKVGPAALAFVTTALNINTHLLPFVREFSQMAELAYAMPGFEIDVCKAMPRWTLRFLHYFPTGDAAELMASHHPDKGGFTPHLWESAPGLERLTFDENPAERTWVPMPFAHDETVIFPGLRMQHRSRCRLKATCHRVVANEQTAKEGRYSAVAFVDFLNTPYFDKLRVGRTQAFAPGFNYDMPFEEFKTYFATANPKGY